MLPGGKRAAIAKSDAMESTSAKDGPPSESSGTPPVYNGKPDSEPGDPGRFLSTHWSIIFTAAHGDSTAARSALEKLCRIYWYPLYAYVRRQGHSVADAQDLTQAFFARFVERRHVGLVDPARGRFRTFLLTSLKHFIVNEWDKANALKRGGGVRTLSLDEERAEERLASEPAVEQAPDTVFDQRWATTLLNRALEKLRDDFVADGKSESFDQLKVYLWGTEEPGGYPALAAKLAMSEGTLKVEVHRLRKQFRRQLRQAMAETVAPEDIDTELLYLRSVLSSPGIPAR